MDLPLAFYAVTICAILLTGISKSGFGGGLGVMAVPMMSVFVDPPVAAAILMPILLAMDILIVIRYRDHWNGPVLATLVPGALFGLALGAAVFQWMDADTIRFAIGCLAIVFVGQFLLGGAPRAEGDTLSKPLGAVLGSVSGFASFVAHAGGPPVKGYLLRQGMDKTLFVGTNTMFFFLLNAIKTVAYGALGSLSVESLSITALLAPVLFLGVFLGTRLHAYIDQMVFVRIVYGFLALTGIKLLWDSVPALFG